MILSGDTGLLLNGTPPGDGEKGNSTLTKIIEAAVAGVSTLGTALSRLTSVYATLLSGTTVEAGLLKLDATGADASMGKATLVAGTVTVNTTRVKTGSYIQLTAIGTTNAGHLGVGTIVDGTSFVISSSSGTDVREVFWEIKEAI